MKKVLFASALMVIAASCAENELDSISAPSKSEGISFEAVSEPTTRMQWDETETSYVPFWYAEQDRIGIFGVNVEQGAFGGPLTPLGIAGSEHNWTGLHGSATAADATYKATRSEQSGAFTSVSDADLLHFKDGKDARFLAVYPSTVKANYADGKLVLSNLPEQANQTQNTVKGDNPATLMYSLSIANKVNSYDAVGEKVNLKFTRPLSALVFSTENANTYTAGGATSIFGLLEKITVTAEGYDADPTDGAGLLVTRGDVLASALAYDKSVATVEVDTIPGSYKATFKAGTTPTESAKVTLNLGASGLAWNDDALAIAAIKNIDRRNFSASKPETMRVVFSFSNIDIEMTNTTSKSWNGYVEYPALNINAYPYLVTKGAATNSRTLIVNSGNFTDIFNENGKIVWTDSEAASGGVSVTEVSTIISKVKLGAAGLATLKRFTNLQKLELQADDAIPANTFTTRQAAAITDLILPNVTSVDQKFIEGLVPQTSTAYQFSVITTLKMPKYEFEDEVVNDAFFNTAEKSALVTIDMSGVRSMMPKFGILRTLSFNGYTKLVNVTVQDDMIVSPSGFANCPVLENVNGRVDISEAPSAFYNPGGSGTAVKNTKLASIDLTSTVIPSNAFRCCTALETVKCKGAAIAPTSIGEGAFVWTAVKYMDLSNAATIGKEAFRASKITKNSATATYLEVGATELPAEVFKECTNIVMVKFTNATKISGDEILNGTTALRQIKFLKEISLADNTSATAYGANLFGTNTANVDLWTNPSQSGVNGLGWTLKWKRSSSATEEQTYTFKSIQKKIED